MAYNPYSAVNAIYKLKGQWDSANNAGDTATKNSVATKAQQYYKQLRNNGYGDIADELTASNYAQAKSINDKWAKMGKTSTRDYLYSLGQSKGIPKSDMDTLHTQVKDYEPYNALEGGEDGLDFYREITKQSSVYLKENGILAYEVGHDQAIDVSRIMEQYGYSKIYTKKDIQGIDRVVIGFKL